MRSLVSTLLIASVAVVCAPRTATPSPSAASPTVAAATTTPVNAGTITGVVGYPAEGHPAMTVIAFSTADRSAYFSVDLAQAATPPRTPYSISVRPGTYHVFAYAQGNDRAGGAYAEYVRCGLRASCSDHTLIDVIVRAGETVRDVDVTDWYGPTDAFPARPR